MRCKNCGWPNKPNEKVCVKCHSSLESAEDHDSFIGNGRIPNGEEVMGEPLIERGARKIIRNADDGEISRPLNKTVREEDVFGAAYQGPQSDLRGSETQGEDARICPKCGYPVRTDSDKCPNCRFPLNSSGSVRSDFSSKSEDEFVQQSSTYRPTRMTNNEAGKGNYRGTINPYMMNMEMEPTFVLKPLKRMNERHDFEEKEYEGKDVVLNRENTEPTNPSITSRQQAAVSRVDGHWYIEDRSEQKTTFVQASHKVELHEGDLILLGNRLFEFHE